jgi:hypothetical protein
MTTSRESQLETALRANAAVRVQAEGLIEAYVAPQSNRAVVNELIMPFPASARGAEAR